MITIKLDTEQRNYQVWLCLDQDVVENGFIISRDPDRLSAIEQARDFIEQANQALLKAYQS